MKEKNIKRVEAYIDGAARNNPGPASLGVVIQGGSETKEYSEFIGEATNNQAEYKACIFALKKIKSIFGKKKIKRMKVVINSDSKLMVKQLQGKYKIKNKEIQKLFLKAWNLKLDFGKIKFKSIPREENEKADQLANEVLKQKKLI